MRFLHKALIGAAVLISGGVIAHYLGVRTDHLMMGLGLVAMGFSLGAAE